MKHFIYALVCPVNNAVKYVGRSQCPETRYSNHLSYKRNEGLYQWIQDLKNNKLKPILKILQRTYSRNNALKLEVLWMNKYPNLFNVIIVKKKGYLPKPYKKNMDMIVLVDADLKAQYAEQVWRLRVTESDLIREALDKYLPYVKKRKSQKYK